jgi:hypothetical protein
VSLRERMRVAYALSLTSLSYGCSETPFEPPGHTAVVTRRNTSPCEDGLAWQGALEALPPSAVQHVEPTYITDTCSGTAQVSGTRLVLAPSLAWPAPWARLLACRTAHAYFAPTRASEPTSSPGWLPEGQVEIAVERDPYDAVVTIHAESVARNIRLLRAAAARFGSTRE